MTDETSWGSDLVAEEGATSATQEIVADETVEEETPVEEVVEDEAVEIPENDPYAEFRDDKGLIHGRFKTPEEAVKAWKEADSLLGKKENEARQARELLDQAKPPETTAPQIDVLNQLAPLLKTPPVELLYKEPFIRLGEANGIRWVVDEHGDVDPDDVDNKVNIPFVRDLMKDAVAEVQAEFQSRQEIAERAGQQFFTAYPELQRVTPLVDETATQLAAEGKFGPDFASNMAMVAREVKAAMASALGKTGGDATAAKVAKQAASPLGGTNRSGAGGEVETDLTKW